MGLKYDDHFAVYGIVKNEEDEILQMWVICTCDNFEIAEELKNGLDAAWEFFTHAFVLGHRPKLGYEIGENHFDSDSSVTISDPENERVLYETEQILHMKWA